MILETLQCRRFYRLLDGLVEYAAARLGTSDSLITPNGYDDDAYRKVLDTLWSCEVGRSLVDEYASENPRNLGRRDVGQIRAWRDGLSERFALVTEGTNAYFLLGGHAFAARGLNREIASLVRGEVAFVKTTLLPFELSITYAVHIDQLSVELSPRVVALARKELEEARLGQRVATSARDLARLAPVARENHERAGGGEARGTSVEAPTDSLLAGMHRGSLAGLPRDVREATLRAHFDDLARARLPLRVEDVGRRALARAPLSSLADALACLEPAALRSLATRYGLALAEPLDRRAAAPRLASAALALPDALVVELIDQGPDYVRRFQALCAEGGLRSVRVSDGARAELPLPLNLPLVGLYAHGGSLVNVVPREVAEAFAGVDWDGLAERANRLAEGRLYVDVLVELRGMVAVEEAFGTYEASVGQAAQGLGTKTDLTVSVFSRVKEGAAAFQVVNLDGSVYFVNTELGDQMWDWCGGDGQAVDATLRGLLEQQATCRPRNPAGDMLRSGGLKAWCRRLPSAGALIAFLDEHVPDGADDFSFADDFVGDCVSLTRDVPNVPAILDVLGSYGFRATEAQLNRLLQLVNEFANDVPKWANNGWAPSEMGAGA